MTIQLTHNGVLYAADTDRVEDCSIPLRFGGPQPNAFHLPRAEAVVARGGDFVGDTRQGGSCNCETVQINPHGNGTHTECIGHLTNDRIDVRSVVRDALFPAVLLSVELSKTENGVVVTAAALQRAIDRVREQTDFDVWPERFTGMIVRTLPNASTKNERTWSGSEPPFMEADAVRFVAECGVRHLLVDIPSLDREDDDMLRAHRTFWGLPAEGHESSHGYADRTITEMIFVDDELSDGFYLVNLQIPPFVLDAAPSRPMIIPVERMESAESPNPTT
jgi:kynurenine formamidase